MIKKNLVILGVFLTMVSFVYAGAGTELYIHSGEYTSTSDEGLHGDDSRGWDWHHNGKGRYYDPLSAGDWNTYDVSLPYTGDYMVYFHVHTGSFTPYQLNWNITFASDGALPSVPYVDMYDDNCSGWCSGGDNGWWYYMGNITITDATQVMTWEGHTADVVMTYDGFLITDNSTADLTIDFTSIDLVTLNVNGSGGTPPEEPPYIYNLTVGSLQNITNISTTNQTTFINFDVNVSANYSVEIWNNPNQEFNVCADNQVCVGEVCIGCGILLFNKNDCDAAAPDWNCIWGERHLFYNNSFNYTHNPYFEGLNYSANTFYVNVTVWDAQGYTQSNHTFTFETKANEASGECVTLQAMNGVISDGATYFLHDRCDIGGPLRINDGKLRIGPSGFLVATGCYVQQGGVFYVDKQGKANCGG